jgi:hypothetical protein
MLITTGYDRRGETVTAARENDFSFIHTSLMPGNCLLDIRELDCQATKMCFLSCDEAC